jgi:hypothetical protein
MKPHKTTVQNKTAENDPKSKKITSVTLRVLSGQTRNTHGGCGSRHNRCSLRIFADSRNRKSQDVFCSGGIVA